MQFELFRVFYNCPKQTQSAIRTWRLLSKYRSDRIIDLEVEHRSNLYFFKKENYRDVEASLALMDDAGCGYEVITPDVGRAQFPQYPWRDDDLAVYEANSKYVPAEQLANALSKLSGLDTSAPMNACI